MRNMEKSKAIIMTDLSYGDTGKGTTTEWFASHADSAAIVRFNGGGQAEHNIVRPDGTHHTFSQFGSASLLPNTVNHLSRDMWVNPLNMAPEARHLQQLGVHDIWQRTTVSEEARIVTPYHRAGNRLRELARGANAHGSTGQGIGEAGVDDIVRGDLTLRAGDVRRRDLVQLLENIRVYKCEQMRALGSMLRTDTEEWDALNDETLSEEYADIYNEWSHVLRIVARDYLATLALENSHVIFEPAQGVLLDEKYGFHPHTTWSNTTPGNAEAQLRDIDFSGSVKKYGILRAYTTRHGYGPFVTEDAALDEPLHEYHNGVGEWQGKFRVGHFDPVAHRYAIQAVGELDGLVVTNIDRVVELPEWKYATGYNVPSDSAAGKYFDMHGSIARDMKLPQTGSKEHVEQLGKMLFEAKPVYGSIENPSADDVIKTIEREMGERVVLASFGPTINDKKILEDTILL